MKDMKQLVIMNNVVLEMDIGLHILKSVQVSDKLMGLSPHPYTYTVFTESCNEIILVNETATLKLHQPRVVQLVCDDGFHLEPPLAGGIVVCTNGGWTPSTPHCFEDK